MDICNKYFGKRQDNDFELSTTNQKLLHRRNTPYKNSKTSGSCPGGLVSFQNNIRKLRPLHETPSMPAIRVEHPDHYHEMIERNPLKIVMDNP